MGAELELNLEYDLRRSNTENLYYHIFGEWPERDCPEYAKELLAACVASEKFGGKKICRFFGLGCERVVFEEKSDKDRIADCITENLRPYLSDLLQLLYSGCEDEKTWRSMNDEIFSWFYDNPDVCKAFVKMLVFVLARIQRENETLKGKVKAT